MGRVYEWGMVSLYMQRLCFLLRVHRLFTHCMLFMIPTMPKIILLRCMHPRCASGTVVYLDYRVLVSPVGPNAIRCRYSLSFLLDFCSALIHVHR